MKKSGIAMGILSMAFLASCTKEVKENGELTLDQNLEIEQLGAATAARQGGVTNVPNELLIKFKKGTTEKGRANALARISGRVQEHILTNAMKRLGDEGVYLVHTPLNALEAIAKAKGLEVEFAEPNWVYTHSATSTDTYYTNGSLWGLKGNYGSNAEVAWGNNHTGSSGVYVGIIDEGIQYNHPDLQGQVWTNPFDPADGVDNDGNGFVDDLNGWDFDGNNNSIYDGGTRGSLDDHGTHVAGTIGAKANNGNGVVGMNWNVTMISGKFLGRRGGTTANAVKAVDYFTDLKVRHKLNIVATNNSWGGGGSSQALLDAIVRAAKQNILFIAAAGNGGSDGVGDDNDKVASFPSNYNTTSGAGYDAVIAVAAITKDGARSNFSNYGATTVDLGAPGSGIWSTTAYNSYSSYSGTSMATPHVTGAAALYAATYPGSTASAIKKAIIDAAIATQTPSMVGKTTTGGRLNVSGF